MGSWGQQRVDGAELDAVTSWDGDEAWVRVDGELDAFTAPILKTELEAVEAADPSRVLLDLSRVRFLDSSGLAVILSLRERAVAAADWNLDLVIAGSDAVEETFEAIEALSLFSVVSAPSDG